MDKKYYVWVNNYSYPEEFDTEIEANKEINLLIDEYDIDDIRVIKGEKLDLKVSAKIKSKENKYYHGNPANLQTPSPFMTLSGMYQNVSGFDPNVSGWSPITD